MSGVSQLVESGCARDGLGWFSQEQIALADDPPDAAGIVARYLGVLLDALRGPSRYGRAFPVSVIHALTTARGTSTLWCSPYAYDASRRQRGLLAGKRSGPGRPNARSQSATSMADPLHRQSRQQSASVRQVRRVEALGEPCVDWR